MSYVIIAFLAVERTSETTLHQSGSEIDEIGFVSDFGLWGGVGEGAEDEGEEEGDFGEVHFEVWLGGWFESKLVKLCCEVGLGS